MLGLPYSLFTTLRTRVALVPLLTLPALVIGCSVDEEGSFSDPDGAGGTTGATGPNSNGSATTNPSSSGGGSTDGAGGTGGPGGSSGGDPGGGDPGESEGTTGEGGTTGEETCDDTNPVELFLSPDDSNSMSSAVQAREAALGTWGSLSSVALRTWEFFNYYNFDYPDANAGEIAVTTELFRTDASPEGEYVLQIAVTSEDVTNADRAPLNITLVLDTSGSMGGHPMDMLKETCKAIAANLKAGDKLSMVTWDTQNAVILGGYELAGANDPLVLAEINKLEAGGGTNLNGGLVAGYALAQQVYDPDRINRIVLISDGGANVGVTDKDLIAMNAGGNDEDGVYMVGVGVGSAESYHDALMDTVTDVGKGASVFVPSQQEAWKVFGQDFVNTLAVAARDVRVKLDLPPGFEIVKFSGEEYSEDPTEIEPQHLAPNDSMVFHQTIRTCAPELVDNATELTVLVQYKDAIAFSEEAVTSTLTFGDLLAETSPLLQKGVAIYEYAEALKTWRMMYPGQEASAAVASALTQVATAEALSPGDADLAEIRTVLGSLN